MGNKNAAHGPGQESVWDYPRPPRVERTPRRIRVIFNHQTVAETGRAFRVLETSHPPTYYIPRQDVRMDLLRPSRHRTYCEYKGWTSYWSLDVAGRTSENAAWSFDRPTRRYEDVRDCLAFYASRVDACFVDEEQVRPQEGDFYGGWITSEIVGPFKGAPGTLGW